MYACVCVCVHVACVNLIIKPCAVLVDTVNDKSFAAVQNFCGFRRFLIQCEGFPTDFGTS